MLSIFNCHLSGVHKLTTFYFLCFMVKHLCEKNTNLFIFKQYKGNATYHYLKHCSFPSKQALLTSTHNLCFRAKIRKNVHPCKPQFYYIKVGFKGVNMIRTCTHDLTPILYKTDDLPLVPIIVNS